MTLQVKYFELHATQIEILKFLLHKLKIKIFHYVKGHNSDKSTNTK
jgi:hypothetical protein